MNKQDSITPDSSISESDLFHAIFNRAADAIMVNDFEGRFIAVNNRFCEMIGYSREEVMKKTGDELRDTEFPLDLSIIRKKLIEQGEVIFESAYRNRTGIVVPIEVHSRVIEYGGKNAILAIVRDIKDRKKAEHENWEQEKLYRTLIETTGTGFVIIDLKGTVVNANAEYIRLTGHTTLAEIQGRSVLDWTAPHEQDKNRNAVDFCVADGFLRNFEIDYITPGGEIIPVELNATVVEIGGANMILTLCRDISHRRKIERKIYESEEQFRKVFEDGPQGMILADIRHHIVTVNNAFCRMIGYAAEELIGRSYSELIHPDQIREVIANTALRDEGKIRINKSETRYLKKNGEILWASVTVSCITDAEGGFLSNLAMVEDISERKKAELALRASETLFRRIIESAPDAVFIQTAGKLAYVNNACCALFGAASPDQLLGSAIASRVHPDFRETVRERIRNANDLRKECLPLEEVYLRLDGTAVPVDVSAVPIEFNGNHGALVFVRDITERKKTEETLRNAQKLESIGVLAGGIAHDFNNLLSGIFGNLDLARVLIEDGDAMEGIAALKRALGVSERARSLTAQLLTFAKGGSPKRRPVALQTLIGDTVRFALSGSNVETEFSLATDLWPCNVDESQISQVIDNIVINAVQAMPAGGTLSVHAVNAEISGGSHALLLPGPYVKISFSDTGVGIPETHLRRIFDPFFSTKQKGSGLGLAISYSIIKRHEGTIEVESEPGKGSSFHIYLPAEQGTLDEQQKTDTREFRGQGMVLVMDDERFILQVASKMLAHLGFTPITAVSGEEAVQKIREAIQSGGSVRAAILDLTIPGGKGGKEYVGEIRALDPSIKTIVSSGYSDDPVMAEPEKYGFSGTLRKPYEIKQFKRVLRECLEAQN
jgi:PAS domain S-box-containing protein